MDPSGFKPSHQNLGEQHLSGSMDSSEFINSNQSNKESNFTSENEHNHNQVTQHGENIQINKMTNHYLILVKMKQIEAD